jgi:hypothetical protein
MSVKATYIFFSQIPLHLQRVIIVQSVNLKLENKPEVTSLCSSSLAGLTSLFVCVFCVWAVLCTVPVQKVGRDSSVGITTCYGLDGPGIESRWGVRYSAPVPEAHSVSCTMGTGSFPGVKRPGRGVDHPPHLAQRLKKEYSDTFTCTFYPVQKFNRNYGRVCAVFPTPPHPTPNTCHTAAKTSPFSQANNFTVLLISKISSTCFGQTFAHLQERKT